MSRGRRWLLVMVVSVVAAACTPPTEERDAAPRAPDEAQAGGALTVGITPPGAIEPTFASSPAGLLIASTVCDTLVHLDPVSGDVKPGLAESWTVSDNGTAITFKLRRGLRFHGSRETLTARDIEFSLSRLADPKEGSYLASLMSSVAGYEQFRDPKKPAERLFGASVIEEHGLQVTLTTGAADIIRLFAHPATAPVSRTAVEANPVLTAASPVCVGPYQLAEPATEDSTEIRLERDENYLADAVAFTGGGRGYADQFNFRIYPDDNAAASAWRSGEVDVVPVPGALAAEMIASAPEDVAQGPAPQVEYVAVPGRSLERTPLEGFDKPEVRRALSLALDRRRLAGVVYGDGRSPADGFIPLGARPEEDLACGTTVPPAADPDAARAMLAEAGVNLSGRTVPFYFNDEFGHSRLIGELAAQWASALGLVVEPRPLSWDELLDKANEASGMDGLFRLAWAPESLSAEAYVALIASEEGGESGPNIGGYNNPSIGRLLYRLQEVGGGDRELRLRELHDALCQELPMIPVAFGASNWLVRTNTVGRARSAVVDASGRLALRELFAKGPSQLKEEQQ